MWESIPVERRGYCQGGKRALHQGQDWGGVGWWEGTFLEKVGEERESWEFFRPKML